MSDKLFQSLFLVLSFIFAMITIKCDKEQIYVAKYVFAFLCILFFVIASIPGWVSFDFLYQ